MRVFLLMMLLAPYGAMAQNTRPIPHPVVPPPNYSFAEQQGTRTATGAPGPNYWQNHASYQIDAVLSPATRRLSADGRVRYINRSPDTLATLHLHLRQNLHRPDAIRNRAVPITGGITLTNVRADDEALLERASVSRPGYSVDGTRLSVRLPEALAPSDSVDLHLSWTFEVPGLGAPRMGQDGEVYFLGFWYPQMAVFDDVDGWNVDRYLGNGEFYMGFADYDVRITVPEDWLVAATGTLVNAEDVLSPVVLRRLEAIAPSDSVVHVVTEADRDAATVDAPDDVLTWHFRAQRVRDFAFGASREYLWDATVANVDGAEPVPVHALYRPGRDSWDQAAEFTRWSVEWLSDRLLPYPFTTMIAVEGLIGGGMEYPMMTLVGGTRTPITLFRTIFHEVAHMWYPMLLASNEKEFAWMDEGLVSLLSDDALLAYWQQEDGYYERYYTRVAGTGTELPVMRPTDEYPLDTSARLSALYGKGPVALKALRGIVDSTRFDEALRTYTERWAYRHPYPWDFFRTIEEVLGQDLEWFWSAYFYETWTLDHAIASVTAKDNGVEVVIEDRGWLPLPSTVHATYGDGRVETRTVPVDTWLAGATSATLTFPAGEVVRVELERVGMDLEPRNGLWEAATRR
ncbi:MAG TPA: M1 family metallopeptidase [Rhodothermales bacterium]